MGVERAAQIAEMESMGFERSQIDLAMRAAFYNSERAIEYLLNVSHNLFLEKDQRLQVYRVFQRVFNKSTEHLHLPLHKPLFRQRQHLLEAKLARNRLISSMLQPKLIVVVLRLPVEILPLALVSAISSEPLVQMPQLVALEISTFSETILNFNNFARLSNKTLRCLSPFCNKLVPEIHNWRL
jgi:hypothetical protein